MNDCFMSDSNDETFLQYYQTELSYLRQAGHAFSKQHPNAARKLDLSDKASGDPHTERLIESFAFLTAKLHQKIDFHSNRVASSLLNITSPHLTSPFPSMCMVQIHPHSLDSQDSIPVIKKRSYLSVRNREDILCRFQTVYPIALCHGKISDADFVSATSVTVKARDVVPMHYLKLSLDLDYTFEDIQKNHLDELIVHISGHYSTAAQIYQILIAQNHSVPVIGVRDENQMEYFTSLPERSLQPYGMEMDQISLPIPGFSCHSHALMKEFFHFPEKFLFFKIKNLFQILRSQHKHLEDQKNISINIYLPVSSSHRLDSIPLNAKYFRLNCTPIINIFEKTTDPIKLDYKRSEYKLVPDQRREKNFEIFAIDKVYTHDENSGETIVIPPYFTAKHHQQNASIFWLDRHVSYGAHQGKDCYLSIIDRQLNPVDAAIRVVFANTYCTNRHEASKIRSEGVYSFDENYPVKSIENLILPTSQVDCSEESEDLWKLVSTLSSHFLTLIDLPDHHILLKDRLKLYSSQQSKQKNMIESIQIFEVKKIVRRMGDNLWKGFSEGLEIKIGFDLNQYKENDTFIFSLILRNYLALYIPYHSFVEMVLINVHNQKEYYRWNPLSGTKELI